MLPTLKKTGDERIEHHPKCQKTAKIKDFSLAKLTRFD